MTANITSEGSVDSTKPKLRVLLAEDDYDTRSGLVQLLELTGFQVHSVSTGSELLEFFAVWILENRKGPPADVLITDLYMPGHSGLQIVETIREQGWQLPVVVISAFGDRQIYGRIQNLGATAFLPKPFDPRELEQVVRQLVPSTQALA